jgi:hypothetical protein
MRVLLCLIALALCLIALAVPAVAQNQRDFLTADEVDQLRLAQEPNLRLQLYAKFAMLRMDEIEQMVASTKAGRATFIHDLLEDYERIVEAIDTVADDALRRKLPLDQGVTAASSAETDFLARLEKIRDAKPKDYARYEFALREAISTTEDSLEVSHQDLQQRASEVAAKENKLKEERKSAMTPKEAAERKEEAKKVDPTPKRKVPTLRRPGETLPGSSDKK